MRGFLESSPKCLSPRLASGVIIAGRALLSVAFGRLGEACEHLGSPAFAKFGTNHFLLCFLHNTEFWMKPPHQHQWWSGQFSSTQETSSKILPFLVCMSAYFDLPREKAKWTVSTFFSRYPQIFGLNHACNIEMQYIYLVSWSRALKVLKTMGLRTPHKVLKLNNASLKELLTYID